MHRFAIVDDCPKLQHGATRNSPFCVDREVGRNVLRYYTAGIPSSSKDDQVVETIMPLLMSLFLGEAILKQGGSTHAYQ